MAPIRKQKVSKACDSCKARKKKCDGTQPCPSCVGRGIACSYVIEDKRRTRYASGFLDSPIGPLNDNDINNNNTNSANNQNDNNNPGTVQTSPITELNVNISKIPTSLRALLNLPVNDQDFKEAKEEDSSKSSWLLPEYNTKENINSSSYKPETSIIHIEHSGPVSSLFLFRNVVSRYELFNLKDSSFVTDVRKITNRNDVVIPINISPHMALPTREYCEFVVNLFHQNLNQMIYMIGSEHMKNKIIDEVYSDPIGVSKSKLCLLYLVLSVGTRFAKALQNTDPSSFPFDKLHDPAIFAQNGMHLLIACDCNLNVEMVESLHALAYYYLFSNAPYMAWTKLGGAIRHAEMIGLNKKKVNHSYADKEFVLHRERLWRSLCIADCILSPMIGRSLYISDNDLNAIGQQLCSDGGFEEEAAHQMAKVCVINARVIRTLYDGEKKQLVFNDLKKLAILYHQWSRQLPYELRLTAFLEIDKIYDHVTGEYKNTRYAYHPLYFLYFTQLFGVILLTKTCLTFLLMRRIHFIQHGNHDGFGEISKKSFVKNFADSCYNAGKFTVEFSYFFWERSMRPDKPFTYVNCVFNAALIIGVVFYTQVAERNNLQHTHHVKSPHHHHHHHHHNQEELSFLKEDNEILLLKAIKVLKNFSHVDTISQRYSQILSNLYNSIKDKDKSSWDTANPQQQQQYEQCKKYNVRREFDMFLFPSIESYDDESQQSDMISYTTFLSNYYNADEDVVILHDTI